MAKVSIMVKLGLFLEIRVSEFCSGVAVGKGKDFSLAGPPSCCIPYFYTHRSLKAHLPQ